MRWIKVTSSKNFETLFNNLDYLISMFKLGPHDRSNLSIGRLAFKEEAAGKLRVFAMVDVITQSLLHPLHTCLFSLFRKLPNDCTHDQAKGFKLAQSLSLKYGCSFGFDLTAATDRLPLGSQISLLNSLFKNEIGNL